MSGGKETPRQKMIGMMYLVLTALLAMNISKDVLLAFITVEEGLNKTNENFDEKNEALYAKFEKGMKDDPEKTKPYKAKADKVKKEAEELCKFIDVTKSELYILAQPELTKQMADTFQLKDCTAKDNYDIPTNYLIGPETAKPTGKGVELKKRLSEFRKMLFEQFPAKEQADLKIGLHTEDMYDHHAEKSLPWEVFNFDHTTVAACMCLLAGIKNDIKNAESDVVKKLLDAIDSGTFKFDVVEAKVVANANYINAGEDYTADVFVSAHSSTVNPIITIGAVDTTTKDEKGKPVAKLKGPGKDVPVTYGVGKLVIPTSAEGDQEYSGIIEVKAPDGKMIPYAFAGKYTVAKPSMAVSPTKMNVFYIGVDNPVDISVAGVAPKDVSASLSGGGTITPIGGGHFIVKVTGGDAKGMTNVNVTKKTKDGQKSAGPPMAFRVKKVPSPQASYAGVVGDGKVSKGEIAAAGGVIPRLEDFVFDLTFPVVSWNMSIFVNGVYVDYTANGASATPQMKDVLQKVKTGQKVMIEEVKIRAPDGIRKIPGCVLKIK
jgi:gliding motility-associated protein GldM